MNLTVSGIVGGVNDHNSTVNMCLSADNWAAEIATKTSSELRKNSLSLVQFQQSNLMTIVHLSLGPFIHT